MALVSCPTASIGSDEKANVRGAVRELPLLVDGSVFYCGFASEKSYGASSYFLQRREGNVLVDSPRAAHPLLDKLAELGGIEMMFLTHRDDVADHDAFHRHFGCRRILHARDTARDTAALEHLWSGHEPQFLSADLLMIPVPGHTPGSAALLFREKYLFTGDHLWWSEERARLHASRSVCWYSWKEQTASMERLLDYRFEWVLPGHGRRYHAASARTMRLELEKLVCRMKGKDVYA